MEEPELARYPGLYVRASVWYVRKRVPNDLAQIEKRSQVRLSLGTMDRRDAIRRYPATLASIESHFQQLRADLQSRGQVEQALATGRLETLTQRQIKHLVDRWVAGRRAQSIELEDEWDVAALLAAVDEDESGLFRTPSDGVDPIEAAADQLLIDAGMVAAPVKLGRIQPLTSVPMVKRSSSQYRYLCQLVSSALKWEVEARRAHLDGSSPPAEGQSVTIGETRCIGDLIAEYRAEREALYGAESTARKYGLLFEVLREVLGSDFPVVSLGRAECIRVMNFLKVLPPNATKRFPRLTLSQAAEHAQLEKLPGLAPNTIGSYMQNLAAILRWAENCGWAVKINTRDLVATRRPKVRRRAFTPEELFRLFVALAALKDAHPTRFWVPALAAYTGARAGEICQLRVADIIVVGGVSCLNLSEFDAQGTRVHDKRLKTLASERIVPLHADLLKSGFMEFVASMGGQERLFPDLAPGPGGNYSHYFSKWFGAFRRSIGLSEPGLVFHSFRHGFRDACRSADIADDTARALGGWAALNQASLYGDRGAVPVLMRAIEKLDLEFSLPSLTISDGDTEVRQ